MTAKTVKFLQECPGEKLNGLDLGKDFLEYKKHEPKKEKLDFIKLQIFLFQRHF